MAFFPIANVEINGIASCVPAQKQSVEDCACLQGDDAAKLSATTGIFERRIAGPDLCTSDLCCTAAERLLSDLGWEKSSVDALVFVTQTPDYILPSTAPLLQDRLGLPATCFTLDISLGCSGYVYGLSTLAAMVSSGAFKRALLLVGDTVSKICSPLDKSTYPLFGDAGTATAISYNPGAAPVYTNLYSDGSGYKSIIVNDGGGRNPVNEQTLTPVEVAEGITRNGSQLILDGMDVFSFGISKAPEVVKELLAQTGTDKDTVDYYVFHQANKLMNEKIRKKLALTPEQVPYTLAAFGNTSCATIPLTITENLAGEVGARNTRLVLCGFGVGLSWGAMLLDTAPIHCSPLIEV